MEGAGLSTILSYLPRVCPTGTVFTHEPGGTERGVEIKKLISSDIHHDFTPETLYNLYWRDRIYHLDEVIRPALQKGDSVIIKHFTAANFAHQIFGLSNHGLRLRFIENCDKYLKDIEPIYHILIDVLPEVAQERKLRGGKPTKFVNQSFDYALVRKGYLDFMTLTPHAVIINGNRSLRVVVSEVKKVVKAILTA